MTGEINFGLLDPNAPAKVAGGFFQGQQDRQQLQQAAAQNKLLQLSLGQKQQEVADSNQLNNLYRAATSPDGTIDTTKLYSGAAQAGLGSKIPELQKSMAAAKTAQLAQRKAEVDALLDKFKVVGQVTGGVTEQAGWTQAKQTLAQIYPDIAEKMPDIYDPATVNRNLQQAMTVKDQLEQHQKDLEQKLNADKFAYQQKNDAANRAVTMRGQDMTDKRERDKLNPSGMTPGAAGGTITGEDYLQTLNPQIGAQVKALAEGRMAFPAGFALKSPYWQNMLSMVSQYDPKFDAVNYNARAKTRADFTSGKAAQNLNAFNTVLGHLDSLVEAGKSLNNGSFPILNKVENYALDATGDPRPKQFDAAKKAVVDELTRAWRGSGGSEQDIKSWSDAITNSSSPQQLSGVAQKIAELLTSKINAMGEQYNQGMGTTKTGIQLLTPHAQAVLAKFQGGANDQSSTTPPMTNAKGWTLHVDANGNKAYVSPDNKQYEEVQ